MWLGGANTNTWSISSTQYESNDHATPFSASLRNATVTNLLQNSIIKQQGGTWTKLSETFRGLDVFNNTVTGMGYNNAGFTSTTPISMSLLGTEATVITISFWKRLKVKYGINIYGYAHLTYIDDTTGTINWSYDKRWSNTDSLNIWEFITGKIVSYKVIKSIDYWYVYGDNAAIRGSCDFAGIQMQVGSSGSQWVADKYYNLAYDTSGYCRHGIIYGNPKCYKDSAKGSYSLYLDRDNYIGITENAGELSL